VGLSLGSPELVDGRIEADQRLLNHEALGIASKSRHGLGGEAWAYGSQTHADP